MTPDKRRLVYTSVAAVAIAFYAANAFGAGAESERIDTLSPTENTTGAQDRELDSNGDGIVTVAEVGDELFYIFDTDGNEVIDNIEWNVDLVHTKIPVETETFTYVDTDRDGEFEVGDYRVSQYSLATALTPYDDGGDGLSPEEFVSASFLEVDDNDDKAVAIDEWRDAYLTPGNESYD
ncbi:MAG: hypothetical protein EOM26_03795 [Alphaproteobacteria bacterium]|nr:hypothetical protein [Alphaproteobacteria bacterium]